jgi:hypothetical protein
MDVILISDLKNAKIIIQHLSIDFIGMNSKRSYVISN